MAYIKYPNYRMYWSSNPAFRMDLIADIMSLKRSEKIKTYLHFVDNDETPENNTDMFVTAKPILDILRETFSGTVTPAEYQSIDKMIIPFKGRSRAKQYIKSKPKKWGFEAWVRSSSDGYMTVLEMYQEKRQGQNNTLSPNFGPIGNTVVILCQGLEGKNRKIILDNFFTTIQLLLYLNQKKIHVLGTIRSNRRSVQRVN
ncbi:piggyBac transposable element-derived protein 2-like [Schistocerca cancellata]|uniref:piggyBac transposable element-derived protein 2-like n=1 Tax=Schistocerca cancellata TaxID=274614 RepID=UPI002118864B|nr:piggyBac transposable element-derived protein 2-like [Schistocerca cancellata]